MRYVGALVASLRYLKVPGFLETEKTFSMEIMIIISADKYLIINWFSSQLVFFYIFLLDKNVLLDFTLI